MDDKRKYDVFEFDDWCRAVDYLLTSAFEYAPGYVSSLALESKPLRGLLKYSFIGPDDTCDYYI